MKTPPLVLAGAAALALSACMIGRGGVNIDDTYIEIRPGTKIDPGDQTKLLTILGKYKKKLYWVADINNRAEVGTLSCVYVNETLLDDVSKDWTAGTGISYSAIQIGGRPTKSNCDNTHHTPNPHTTSMSQHTPFLHHTPNPHVSGLSPADYQKSRALVNEVKPILQKYSHQ